MSSNIPSPLIAAPDLFPKAHSPWASICATPSSSGYLNWRDEVDFNATPGDSREGQKAIRPTFEATLNAVARFEIEITRSADALAEF